VGKKVWLIPDGYLPERSEGEYVSHESVCLLNCGQVPANVNITIYFEERDPLRNLLATVGAERTNHVRLDRIVTDGGEKIPRGVPYALCVVSDQPIVVQHSRLDTSQPSLALFTTMAYPVE